MKRRRRRYRRKGKRLSSKVYKNYKDLKLLKNAVEHKFLDGSSTITTVDNLGDHYQCLNLVNQNDVSAAEDPDWQNRNGREIWATRIKIRGYIDNSNGTPADGIMRIIVARLKEKQDNIGGLFDSDGLLFNEAIPGGTVLSFRNKDSTPHWTILSDTTFGYDTTQHTQIPFKINHKLNHQVKYDTPVGVAGNQNIVKNALFIFAVTNQATEVNAPDMIIEWRYSFMDL